MADDAVVVYIKKTLLELGFRREKRRFVKKLQESEAEIEIQNNRFDKRFHYINVEISFDEDVAKREGLADRFGVWFRAESLVYGKTLNRDEQINQWHALDSSHEIKENLRFSIIDKILNVDLKLILDGWSTFQGAQQIFQSGILQFNAVNHELKSRWSSEQKLQEME